MSISLLDDWMHCCCRKDLIPFENAKIIFVDEVFAIERPGTQLNVHTLASGQSDGNVVQPLSELLLFMHTVSKS